MKSKTKPITPDQVSELYAKLSPLEYDTRNLTYSELKCLAYELEKDSVIKKRYRNETVFKKLKRKHNVKAKELLIELYLGCFARLQIMQEFDGKDITGQVLTKNN